MQHTEEKDIDGFRVEVSHLPAREASRAFARVCRLLGPSLPDLGRAVDEKGGKLNLDLESLGSAFAKLAQGLTDAEHDALLSSVLKTATLDGAEFLRVADAKLMGRLDVLYKSLAFAVEVQFGPLFAALRGLVARPAASPSPASSD